MFAMINAEQKPLLLGASLEEGVTPCPLALGTSGFAFQGTNAHAIITAPSQLKPTPALPASHGKPRHTAGESLKLDSVHQRPVWQRLFNTIS